MTIAMTTSGTTLDAPLDTRFGRATRFLSYDLERDAFTLLDNAWMPRKAPAFKQRKPWHATTRAASA